MSQEKDPIFDNGEDSDAERLPSPIQLINFVWSGISNLVRDAYRVNATLFGEKFRKDNNSLLEISEDSEIGEDNETGLTKNCIHYKNPTGFARFGLGFFSAIGGLFYVPWRFFKDSIVSASFEIKTGINDAFLRKKDHWKTRDSRNIVAKLIGGLGKVFGLAMRLITYIIAMAGISRYGYHHLVKSLKESSNLLFGTDLDLETHKQALYDPPSAKNPSPSFLSLFVCEFNLAKLATLAVYGSAALFAVTLGSTQSWHEMDRWIYHSGKILFGEDSFFRGPVLSASQDGSTFEQDKLKFFSRFGVLPWLVGGLMVGINVVTKILNLAFRFLIGSEYTWRSLTKWLKQEINFIFGAELGVCKDNPDDSYAPFLAPSGNLYYVSDEKSSETYPVRDMVSYVGLLMRSLQVLSVGVAFLFGAVLGSRQSWCEVGRWFRASEELLFGEAFLSSFYEIKKQDESKEHLQGHLMTGSLGWIRLGESNLEMYEPEPNEKYWKTGEFWSRFGILPWLVGGVAVCATVLMKGVNLAFRLLIGSAHSWQSLNSTFIDCVNFVFTTHYCPTAAGKPEKPSLLQVYADSVGLLLRITQGLTYVFALVFKIVGGIVVFGLNVLWKLTLGNFNFTGNPCGADGYFNRIYNRFFRSEEPAANPVERIQQQFSDLLRALTPFGEIPPQATLLYRGSTKIDPDYKETIKASKELGFGFWILSGFLYDMRKSFNFGANTLTEQVIIEFAKAFQAYSAKHAVELKTKTIKYDEITTSFFKSEEATSARGKFTPFNSRVINSRVTFVEKAIAASEPEVQSIEKRTIQ